MTTLICDFQSIVGEKIKGYATLTAGKVRPSYSSPAVVVHEPTKQEVIEGQTTFENVNPGDAVITVEWADQTQSATIRFVVPESEEAIYLADCLSADSLDPEEIDLLRWGIRENLSGAREMLETAKSLGLTEINGTVDAYFTEAAEILRKALEAAQLAEQSLGTIDDKVASTEGVVTDVDQAKQQIQDLLDELAALELELGDTNTDLAGAVDTINTISPQVSAATQAASEATQKAQNAVNELNTVQTANAAEFNTIKQDLDSATQTAKSATDAVAQTNQQLGIEVQRILGEVDTALNTATEATAQARIANENLETYQYQLGEIQQEQGHILGQQAEIVGSFEHQLAEIERLSTEISTASSELDTISGEQSALVEDMNKKVGSLNELTATQGAAITAAKSQADKGVSDAAAASNALTNYKKVNDPKVAAAQSTADTARAEAVSMANAARIAAEGVAKELADKAQADAEVAAAAEALRIAQEEATAAKNAASADATAKADAAQSAAETLAKAEAKAAQEAAELTAAQDAATKAENARIAAEANAKVLSDKAQQAAATAKARADKGVTDAATALAKANEANNKLPSITADVSAAAKVAADAANALPGIRTEISTAKKQADKGVADAKAVNDKIPAITQAISGLQEVQVGLGNKAQQGIDDAKVAADLVRSRVDVGTSLVGLSPGTTRPAWSAGMDPVPESENPLGLADAYVARAGQVGNHEYATVSASDKVKYRVSFWLKASEPGSDLVFDARSPVPVPAGGNTLAFAGNEAVEGALDPGDAGRLFWVKNIPTEWTYYEGIKTPAPGLKHFYIGTRYWRHGNGSNRTADQYVADLRIEPVIPSQDDVNKLLIDTAQNHTDILKAQGDINTAQGEINENNRVFQAWQKTINDQQAKWNEASSNATAALARFAITQSQWNDVSSKATNANTKAIESHTALFAGQHKWNEVANAAIQTAADFATKQLEWNAVQKKVNDNFQNWQDAATEMLTSTGKFQKLQTQFNSDQKKWNATQELVNDKQKGINALNTKTDDAQNTAIEGLTTAVRLAFPQLNILTTLTNGSNVVIFGSGATHHLTDRPSGVNTSIHGTRSVGGVNGQLPASTVANSTSVVQGLVYRFVWWTKHVGGTNAGLSLRVRTNPSDPLSASVMNRYSLNGGETWSTSTMVMCSPPLNGGWERWEALIEFKAGTTTFTPAFATNGDTNQFQIYGLHASAYFPVQEQIDKAQNDALAALNRFAINQVEWNKVSTDATNALKAGQAAQQELNQKREDWEKGATLAINNLQTTSAKYQQWTNGAALAIANLQTTSAKFKQWTKAAEDALEAGKKADKAQDNAIAALTEIIGDVGENGQEGSLTHRVSQMETTLPEELADLRGEISKNTELAWNKHHWIRDSGLNLPTSKYFSITGDTRDITITAEGTWIGSFVIIASTASGGTFQDWRNVTAGARKWTITKPSAIIGNWERATLDYRITPGEAVNLTSRITSKTELVAGGYRILRQHTVPVTTTINASLNVGWHAATYDYRYGIRIRAGANTILAEDGPRTGVGPRLPIGDGYRNMNRSVRNRTITAGTTIYFEAYVSSGGVDQRTVRDFTANINYIK